MRRLAFLLTAALCACSGTVPPRNAPPEQAISAILIGLRLITPTGETRDGRTDLNFESEGGRQAEIYRLPLDADDSGLYLVEPGTYRLTPPRHLFGSYFQNMTVVIDGREHRLAFPRELLRLDQYEVKPKKILAIGMIEARLMPSLPGRKPEVRVRLDDSVATRRKLIQDTVKEMMDPRRSTDERESSIAWSRALQNSLMELLSEPEPRQNFKPAR